jgi:glycerol-3-phosphate dehydrogenase subunit C
MGWRTETGRSLNSILFHQASEAVAKKSFDQMEYLFNLRKQKLLKEDYQAEVGSIGYHLPCHLKVQKIGFRSCDIVKKLPGEEV